jgi:hypothetical protein
MENHEQYQNMRGSTTNRIIAGVYPKWHRFVAIEKRRWHFQSWDGMGQPSELSSDRDVGPG